MRYILLAIAFVLVNADGVFAEEAPMRVKAAVNSTDGKVGKRPYEMEGRREDRVPLVDFEDLSSWIVQCSGGADADFSRSREQQMWSQYVGKLTYTGKSDSDVVILRPQKPIPINGEFDCINMWVHGNLWEWAPDPGTPFVNIAILTADASGKEERLPLVRVRWKEWFLAHTKLGSSRDSRSLTGIEVRGMNNSEPRAIYFDSLYFYKEKLNPLKYSPRPSRNLTPLPGQDQGLNTGPDKLPFPTREETILPTNFEQRFANRIRETSPGHYELSYTAGDCTVKYTYEPSKGDLGEIAAYINSIKVSNPMMLGGIEIDGKRLAGKLIEASLKDNEVHAAFELGEGKSAIRADYVLRIWQKSLVMDFMCRGGKATGLALGEMREVTAPSLVLMPFLTFGASNPRVLCSRIENRPAFSSVWIDWYRSNGSQLWSEPWAKENSSKINGGVRYNAKTDGKLNDLYERVFLTVSPTFEETLPTIANPPSPRGKEAGERLWQETWGPGDYKKEMERSTLLRSYGIDKLTQCNHEITWRDDGESFTLRTSAAPGKGGDAALKEYVTHQKSLGWLSGLYTNYTDFAPVNKNWNEDYVQFTPSGEWRPAWPRNYALKPSRAVELDAKYSQAVKNKFDSNAAYTDVQTAVAPWDYCDYDARVPGAGTFTATFYAYGELLLNDQKVYGPIWSEGTYHWLYAGLASGNYGIAYTDVDIAKQPLNVAFDLMKIHPLECDIAVPWIGHFYRNIGGWDKPENIDSSIDRFIATTIAYGHIGWLVEEQHGIERTCRSYYMMQQLQRAYAMREPAKIEYADDAGNLRSASEATADPAILAASRIHISYKGGLQVWVNGSGSEWRVWGDIVLPQWGWFAINTDTGFVEFSAIRDGHRVDYVRSGDYEYLDARGTRAKVGSIAVKGAIALRRRSHRIEIIDIYGNDRISFDSPRMKRCTAFDAGDKSLGSVELRYMPGDVVEFDTVKNARKYILER